jgi:S1-C subfamily serine protease
MNISRYLALFLVAPTLTFAQPSFAQNTEPDLNQTLTMYVKPSVVRIVSICNTNYIWKYQENSDEFEIIPHNLSFIGTGFIINPNGYIVTSSKVFESKDDCRDSLVRNIKNSIDRKSLQEVNPEDIKIQDEDLDYEQKLYLPYSSNNPVIFENDKPLEVKNSGRDFGKPFEVSKDVAVVKVALRNAPVLKLGDSSQVEIQDSILMVGYPNADLKEDLTEKSYLEASVQEGRISNPNKEMRGGYPVLQIDIRASDGNAGSPLIDNKGEVVGIITSKTDENGTSLTDIPLAIPTSTIQEFIRQSGAINQQGETDELYRDGLNNLWKGNYQEAKAKFLKVKALYPFHSEVDRLISEIDQIEAERWAKPWKNPTYIFTVGLILAAGVVGGVAYFLLKQKSNLVQANAGVRGSATRGNSVFTSSFTSNGKGKKCLIEMEYKGQIQRFQLYKDEHRLGRDPNWSDFDLPTSWEVISRHHAILQKEGDDYRIFDGDKQVTSRNGLWINDDYRVDPKEGYLLNNGDQLKIGQDASEQILLTYYNPNKEQANLKTTMAN